MSINSLPANGQFCHLITFANSLDPDQARHNVGPDLDSSSLTPLWYFCLFFLKVDFEEISRRQKRTMENYPACKELMMF